MERGNNGNPRETTVQAGGGTTNYRDRRVNATIVDPNMISTEAIVTRSLTKKDRVGNATPTEHENRIDGEKGGNHPTRIE